jgi:hypothetical protein
VKNWLFLFMAINAVLTAGCGRDGSNGKDGQDGKAYISYSWNYNPFYYSTTDPGIIHPVINNNYYATIAGTYYYTYQSWDGSIWTGSYTITINHGGKGTKGEKGGIFWQNGKDGENGPDGADNYFKLYCPSGGPYFYRYSYAAYSAKSFIDISLEDLTQMDIRKKGAAPLPENERNKFIGMPMPGGGVR